MTDEQMRSQRDRRTLTTSENRTGLTEQELSRVTGGFIWFETKHSPFATENPATIASR
jgi:hypothetical protein